jgi:hypothetical protein
MLATAAPASKSPAEDFLESYRDALFRRDMPAITESCRFPLAFHDVHGTVIVPDAEAAEKAFLLLRHHYEDLGMTEIELRFAAMQQVSSDFVLVDAVWRLLDEAGMTIMDQRSTYLLRDDGRRARIVSVVLHEDMLPVVGNA